MDNVRNVAFWALLFILFILTPAITIWSYQQCRGQRGAIWASLLVGGGTELMELAVLLGSVDGLKHLLIVVVGPFPGFIEESLLAIGFLCFIIGAAIMPKRHPNGNPVDLN